MGEGGREVEREEGREEGREGRRETLERVELTVLSRVELTVLTVLAEVHDPFLPQILDFSFQLLPLVPRLVLHLR